MTDEGRDRGNQKRAFGHREHDAEPPVLVLKLPDAEGERRDPTGIHFLHGFGGNQFFELLDALLLPNQLLHLVGVLTLSARSLQSILARDLRRHLLLDLLKGLHDSLRKCDGVDVVVGVLFEERPELLAGGVLLPLKEVGRPEVFASFDANDRVRGTWDDATDERLQAPRGFGVVLLIVISPG